MVTQSVEDGFPDAFDGKFVSVSGLTSATELNDTVGCIISYVERSDRFRVQFRDGLIKALLPANLRLVSA